MNEEGSKQSLKSEIDSLYALRTSLFSIDFMLKAMGTHLWLLSELTFISSEKDMEVMAENNEKSAASLLKMGTFFQLKEENREDQ
jgi:hypothetical protein